MANVTLGNHEITTAPTFPFLDLTSDGGDIVPPLTLDPALETADAHIARINSHSDIARSFDMIDEVLAAGEGAD